jgi:hypothetical protein
MSTCHLHLAPAKGVAMPFVNEFVSEEDVEKYGLDQLMKMYDKWGWRNGRPSIYKHSWTIDRERGVFAKPLMTWQEVGPSGRSEPTAKTTWVVDVEGQRATAVLDRAAASSVRLADSPYRIVWNLVHLDLSSAPNLTEAWVLSLLKEALTAYGQMGVFFQAPNTVVSFNF